MPHRVHGHDALRSGEPADDLFPGTAPQQLTLGVAESDLGIGNRLTLLDDELLKNLGDIQLRNGLPPSRRSPRATSPSRWRRTGKTYVYLRTIFELNKRYGFTKFVIVVPSVAIKEGVYKTLQITEEHFKGLYAGAPFDYFLYDSAKLGQVRNFATSPQHPDHGGDGRRHQQEGRQQPLQGQREDRRRKAHRPDRATRPIVIVDEPQSVDGGLRARARRRWTR